MKRALLLDIGNSRLKWGMATDGRLAESGVVAHEGEPAAALRALQLPRADAVWVAHVTGVAHEAALTDTLRAFCGCEPRYARTAAHWRGLRNAYRQPERLGIDRWLAMLAAWSERPGSACVVDAGTALTIDCIDGGGQHLGGIIGAGLQTQQRAVLGHTRFAAHMTEPLYDAGLGRDTEACVRQGAMLACLGAIDRGAAIAGAHARLLLTGGDAPVLLPHLRGAWEHRPHFVLEGLLALALATEG